MKNRQVYWRRSGGDHFRLRVADHRCIHPEVPVVHFIPDSAVRWMI